MRRCDRTDLIRTAAGRDGAIGSTVVTMPTRRPMRSASVQSASSPWRSSHALNAVPTDVSGEHRGMAPTSRGRLRHEVHDDLTDQQQANQL